MALVARTRRRDHVLGGGGTLLAQCVITLLQGATELGSPASHEAEVLAKNGAGPNQRLSCQCEPPSSLDLLITTGYW
jgi:ferredoxin